MKIYLLLISLVVVFSSCNKEKPFSKKLMKGESWLVKSISVDGTRIGFKGHWNVTQDINIYDSVPSVTWLDDANDAIFEWQFQEKGKKFFLSYVQQCSECNGSDLDTLDYITYNLTGIYLVEQHRRKKMKFTSTKTIGYSGKKVEISIERAK